MTTPRRHLAELKTPIDKKARRARLKSSKLDVFAPSLLHSSFGPGQSARIVQSTSESWSSSSRDSDFMSCCDSGEFNFAQPSSPRFGSSGGKLIRPSLSTPFIEPQGGRTSSPDSGTPTAFAAIFHNRATSMLSHTASAAAESLRNHSLPRFRPPAATPRSVQPTRAFTPLARSMITVPSSASESDSGLSGVPDALSSSEPSAIPISTSKNGVVSASAKKTAFNFKQQVSVPTIATSATLTKKNRQVMAENLYAEFNKSVFDGMLPDDVPLVWNNRLQTTAGQSVFVLFNKESTSHDDPAEDLVGLMSTLNIMTPRSRAQEVKVKRIELASKLLTSRERLAKTLLHECCHLGQRLLEDEADQPHGPLFKKWALKATSLYPQFEVSIRHEYEVHLPYHWECRECQFVYKRRNKKSIDPTKHRCGQKGCRGRLVYLGDQRIKDEAPRGLTRYQEFVKENYAAAQKEAKTPQEIMGVLAKWWKNEEVREDNNEIPNKQVDDIPNKQVDEIPNKQVDEIPNKQVDEIPNKQMDDEDRLPITTDNENQRPSMTPKRKGQRRLVMFSDDEEL